MRIFLILLLFPVMAQAIEIVSIDSVNVTTRVIEPTTNTDDSPLTDLANIRIYYNIGSGPVEAGTFAASSQNGGGTVEHQVPVPIGDGQEADVEFTATALDSSGNESPHSVGETLRIDRLAPKAPQ